MNSRFVCLAVLTFVFWAFITPAHADTPNLDGFAGYGVKIDGETFSTDTQDPILVQPKGFATSAEICDLRREKPIAIFLPAEIKLASNPNKGPLGVPIEQDAYLLYIGLDCGKIGGDFTEAVNSRLGAGLVTIKGKPGPKMALVPAKIVLP